MKIFLLLLSAITFQLSSAQVMPVEVSTRITTSILLHRSIKHIDVGSPDVIVQPIQTADSILLLKAANDDFPPTNLTVITSDGSLHVFRISYADQPSKWSYTLPLQQFIHPWQIAERLLNFEQSLHGVKGRAGDVRARLTGIYVHENLIYLVLYLENAGELLYSMDGIRLYLRDKKRPKRVALQERVINSILIHGDTNELRAQHRQGLVVAIERRTLPENQMMVIEIQERNGGRNLSLYIRPNKILQAKRYN